MAYTQKPGRTPFLKTGRNIPTPFLQTNIKSGSDLKAEASAKAEKMRAADKSKLATGESKSFTGTASDITLAKTPQEIADWQEAVKKPGAGRNIRKESVTVKKEGFSNLKPAGIVSTTNQITGAELKPSTSRLSMPSGMSWTKSDTNQKFGGNETWGMSPTGSAEIKAGTRKQSIDTDPNITSQGRPFSTGEANQYQSKPLTPQEMNLYNRGRLSGSDNPYGKDPVKHQKRLNALEEQLSKNDQTIAERKAATKAKVATAVKTKTEKKTVKLTSRKKK